MYLNQNFYKLRDQCISNGKLFEDPFFEPSERILKENNKFRWLRPKEIVKKPKFFVEGFSRFDIDQGSIGDCWLLAAIISLTQTPNLFFNVVHEDNSFEENYAGIFHFRFWLYGEWVDVVIDDRLPTSKFNKKLVFMHSDETSEFWSALLEKAYAKFYGSYEFLRGGNTCEAQEDFTGGVAEIYNVKVPPTNLYQILEKAYKKNSLIGCSIEADEKIVEAITPQGLVKGHAYSITKVQMINISTPNKSGKIQVIRMRNPWGNEVEWNGAWSDKSLEWKFIPESDKNEIGLTFDHDGEFYMSFQDFLLNFDLLEVCNLITSFIFNEDNEIEESKNWFLKMIEGEWVAKISAGGCRNYIETFHLNPKFVLDLKCPDKSGKCSIIIALLQKNRRRCGLKHLSIGFLVYDIQGIKKSELMERTFYETHVSIARSHSYVNMRGNSRRFKFPPGKYVIIPSTFDPGEEGEFLIRVISESVCDISKLS